MVKQLPSSEIFFFVVVIIDSVYIIDLRNTYLFVDPHLRGPSMFLVQMHHIQRLN